MKKETITLSNIQEDLALVAKLQISNEGDGRLVFIIPLTLLAILGGIFLKSIWIPLPLLAATAYHAVRFVSEYRDYKANMQRITDGIQRGDVSITTERFSHAATERIIEPHQTLTKTKITSIATFFYFEAGRRWRVPKVDKHYKWSKEYYVSTKGLENISLQGDEFFYVSLQGNFDIAYIYPCKNFALDPTLK
jgi:hypothetical protein